MNSKPSTRSFGRQPGLAMCAALTLTICAATLLPHVARSTIVGPYTNDVNTLHLWHLDETVVPCIDSATGGTNLTSLQSGSTLGNAAYAGFGNAVSTYDGGPAATAQGGKDAILSCRGSNSPVIITYANPVTRAFTYEAIVRIDFDPQQSEATVANGGTGRNSLMQILTCEANTTGQRIFQWRINPVGFATTPAPSLEFINVNLGVAGQNQNIPIQIPTNGPDAILSNQWYHVAVSFTGTPNTANNLKVFWTLLDPSRTAANLIGTGTLINALPPAFGSTNTILTIGNIGRPTAVNNFVGLIDEVRMSSVERNAVQMMFSSSALSLASQPQSQFVAYGDTVTLSPVIGGESPRYQWQHSSTNLPGATNAVLVLSNIVAAQAGDYQLFATNSTSSTNTAIATITLGSTFSEVFNTGLSDNRTLLSGGDVDPHYQLIHSDDPNYPGPAEIVVGSLPASYLANGPSSMWLAPVSTGNAAPGLYTNRTTFLLDTMNPTNAVLNGNWAMDNQGMDILLNGVSLGITDTSGQGSFRSFTITNGFVPGVNTLDFAITNQITGGANPTGWRIEMRGIGLALSNATPFLTETDLPMNVTTQAQQNVSFSVAAAGSGPLSYQWYHGATLLAGQTTRRLNLAAVTTADGGTYSVTITNSAGSTNASATLTVVTPPALVWVGNDSVNPTFWDAVTTNWLDSGLLAPVAFAQFDDVRFDSTGIATSNVDLVVPLTPNTVTVDTSAGDYTFMSSGAAGSLAGSAILIKTNTGNLIVNTVNSNSGPTVISGGSILVGGALGSGLITNSALLRFNRGDSFTVANTISGSGSVTMEGTGTLGLSGNNNYSGTTTVSSGTLLAKNSTALGSTNGGTVVASGGQLYIFGDVTIGAEPLTLSGVGPASDGALRKAAGVGPIFGGPISLAADATIGVDAAATLTLTNAAGIAATDLNLTVSGAGANSRGNVNGPVSLGAGGVTQNNPGTWVFTATNNNWNGGTTLNGGAMQIGDGGNNGSIGGGTITLNGGTTLTFNSAANLAVPNPIQHNGNLLSFVGTGNYTVSGTIANNGTNTYNNPGNILVSGEISGGGVLNQNGSGTLTLSGTNSSYSGTVTIRTTGVLRPANSQALGTGTCQIGSAQTDTCRLELLGGLTIVNPITIFPRAFGTQNNPANILNVSGTNIVSPPSSILIPIGGNLLTLQSDSGRLIYAGGVTAGGAGRDLALKGAAAGEIQGNIDHTGGNSVLIWKLDSGTWTLSGTNTPNAATTISNGVLVINGTMDGSLITVAGGTLGGTGVIGGPVVVNSGATLSPGSSIGTLTVSNLTLQPGSTTFVELNKTALACDKVVGLSNVTYGGTLVISNLSGTLAANDSFKLFDSLAYAGSFTSLSPTNPSGAGIRWNTNTLALDGTLRVLSTTPSQPGISSVANAGGNLIIAGTNGSPWGNYAVLSTNNLAIPRTNWPVIATGLFDGSGNFNYTNAIQPSGQQFFLLRAL